MLEDSASFSFDAFCLVMMLGKFVVLTGVIASLQLCSSCQLEWVKFDDGPLSGRYLTFDINRGQDFGVQRCVLTKNGQYLGSVCGTGSQRSYFGTTVPNEPIYALNSTTPCFYASAKPTLTEDWYPNLPDPPAGTLTVQDECNGQISTAYVGVVETNGNRYYGIINHCNEKRLTAENMKFETFKFVVVPLPSSNILSFDLKELKKRAHNETTTTEFCNNFTEYRRLLFKKEKKLNISIVTIFDESSIGDFSLSRSVLPYASELALHKLGMASVDRNTVTLTVDGDKDILKAEQKVVINRPLMVPPTYGFKVKLRYLIADDVYVRIVAVVRLKSQTVSGLELGNFVRRYGQGLTVLSSNYHECDVRITGSMRATLVLEYDTGLEKYNMACANTVMHHSNSIVPYDVIRA